MEEWAPPVAAAIHPLPATTTTTAAADAVPPPRRASSSNYSNIPSQAPYHPRKISKDVSSFSLKVQPNTYIVQIPKDQIFSVPPPEHGEIVERYREEKNSGKGSAGNGCCSSRCLTYTLCFFILVGAITGISIGVKHAITKPELPTIKIKSFNVKNNGGKLARFYVVAMVRNDGRMHISPDGNSDASLMYKTKEIGSGRFPGLRIGSGESKSISLRLKASRKKKFPKAVKASMADKKGKKPISVELVMRISVVMSASGIKSQSKEIDVNCKLRVSSLGSNKGIMSQKCQLNFL